MTAQSPSSHDKILDVAEALFARRGFSGVGMREVADAVGLGKSSVFHHFRTKTQLYFEVLDRVLQRIEDRLAPVQVGNNFDDDGTVANVTTNGSGFVEFDLVINGQTIAHVVTDGQTAIFGAQDQTAFGAHF